MRAAPYDSEVDRMTREVQREQDARQKRSPRLVALRERIHDAYTEKHWSYETAMEFEALERSVDDRIDYGKDCTEDGEIELLKRLARILAEGVAR